MNSNQGLFTHESIWISLLKGGAKRKDRDLIASVVRDHINHNCPVPRDLKYTADSNSIVRTLKENGLAYSSSIFTDNERVQLLTTLSGLKVEYLNASSAKILRFDYLSESYEVHPDIHYARYNQQDLLMIPVINRLINDINISIIPLGYLGCVPTLSSVNCWWSFPGKKIAGAQNFHQDRGDFASLNMFTYLSDVDKTSGPHVYCQHTHTLNSLIKLTSAMSPVVQSLFWEWWEQHRKSDLITEYFFKPTVITGRAGTTFFEDTCGLHKGLAPTHNKRLCFELVWTMIPQFNHRLVQVPNAAPVQNQITKRISGLAYKY